MSHYFLPGEHEEIEVKHRNHKNVLRAIIGVLVFIIVLCAIAIDQLQLKNQFLTKRLASEEKFIRAITGR